MTMMNCSQNESFASKIVSLRNVNGFEQLLTRVFPQILGIEFDIYLMNK
jgi:hypothetical protein